MRFNVRSFGPSVPSVTKHLIIINVIMWLATFVSFQMWKSHNDPEFVGAFLLQSPFYKWFALHFWQAGTFRPWQLLTHMFLHDPVNIYHILCNMFMLWMFGGWIERALGSKRYLLYYILCGLCAGLVQELSWQMGWHDAGPGELDYLMCVGASGAVFGILLAYGMLFPNMKLYIIPFPFPVKAKWVVLGYGALELFFGVSGMQSGVAHFAHLGGMIAGIILILYWKHTGVIRRNGFY